MKIKSVKPHPTPRLTVDIEVAGTHSYQLENGTVVHNTTSLVLGTSSGIHAWHNDYYIRRIRVGKNEAIYQYLLLNHPELVEDEFLKPTQQAVISLPQKAPDGAITRGESALDLLGRVKEVWTHWVKPGHRSGANYNNVSTTVTVKPDEWEVVGEWMWENRNNFTALSVLPYDGGSYVQAPFEDITKEEFEEMAARLTEIHVEDIIELEDNTDLQGEIACGGASSSGGSSSPNIGCEVV